eukprot:11194365-Lingulodinium_polyedra.AAC.1
MFIHGAKLAQAAKGCRLVLDWGPRPRRPVLSDVFGGLNQLRILSLNEPEATGVEVGFARCANTDWRPARVAVAAVVW